MDCDVIQADGGTRTAAITGAYVALDGRVPRLEQGRRVTRATRSTGRSPRSPSASTKESPCWISTTPRTLEAETDLNVVMNENGGFIEIQGTAEGHAFRREELEKMLSLAEGGVESLIALQRDALED